MSNAATAAFLAFLFYLLYILIIVISTAVVILIKALIDRKIASTVEKKGYTLQETHAWAMCFWLGMFGYIYVIALPDRTVQRQNEEIISLLRANRSNYN